MSSINLEQMKTFSLEMSAWMEDEQDGLVPGVIFPKRRLYPAATQMANEHLKLILSMTELLLLPSLSDVCSLPYTS